MKENDPESDGKEDHSCHISKQSNDEKRDETSNIKYVIGSIKNKKKVLLT